MSDAIDAVRAGLPEPLTTIQVDGGMSGNDSLLQALADLSGSRLERGRTAEATALGAGALAGLGAGDWDGGRLTTCSQPRPGQLPSSSRSCLPGPGRGARDVAGNTRPRDSGLGGAKHPGSARANVTGPAAASASALSQAHRAASLSRMTSEVLDILVVGGGVTGTGAALDAASRGLSVGLIEARDYAAGASSKSSKLIHGGLRYLEMLDFALVREALRERRLLLTRLAPHLVKPVAFVWPLTHRIWERPYWGPACCSTTRWADAALSREPVSVTKTQLLAAAPGLRPNALVGGVRFYDAQEDDARMVAVLARTAAGLGAALATNVRMDPCCARRRASTPGPGHRCRRYGHA